MASHFQIQLRTIFGIGIFNWAIFKPSSSSNKPYKLHSFYLALVKVLAKQQNIKKREGKKKREREAKMLLSQHIKTTTLCVTA